jgi:hypothetical protein
MMTGGRIPLAKRNETIHAPLFWRERSLLSVTDRCREKRGDNQPYADLRRIASAKMYGGRRIFRAVTTERDG